MFIFPKSVKIYLNTLTFWLKVARQSYEIPTIYQYKGGGPSNGLTIVFAEDI